MKYRPEIDGLRAIAVIPVILFHAGFSSFEGGFVGVDVFFVISGYLITTIILSQMEEGSFSIVNFYERRARRLLPPLFLVMFVSLLFSWFWLLPADMKDFSQSLVAVSSYTSNILFWSESGYWDTAAELKPLLHTWSLAVEEQFYILFPLFLMAMWRFRKRWIFGAFILITLLSLAAAQWGAYYKPSATFYLLPTRGWELSIGATIAFCFLYKKQMMQTVVSNKLINEVFGLFGLLLIGYAILNFDEKTPFPSLYTLIPTIGSGLIILFTSPQTLVGNFLSAKLFVGIGLISYSAYLWHQPLLSFARHVNIYEPSKFTYAILAFLSLPLAYFTWRFVENPFRSKHIFSRKSITVYSLIGSLFFIVIGLSGHLTNGFGFRNSQLTDELGRKLMPNSGLSKTCDREFTLSTDCRTDNEPEMLIWGDSYAMHLVQGIMTSNPDAKIIQMTKTSCGPFFDIAPIVDTHYSTSWAKECLIYTDKVRQWVRTNDTVKYAVLSSPFSLSGKSTILSRSGEILPATIQLASEELQKTLQELEMYGIKPVVISPPPTNGHNLGRCLARAEWRGLNFQNCNFTVADIAQYRLDAYQLLEIVDKRFEVIRLDKILCDDMQCKTHINQAYIYRDEGHLSHEGSATLGKTIDFYNLITSQ